MRTLEEAGRNVDWETWRKEFALHPVIAPCHPGGNWTEQGKPWPLNGTKPGIVTGVNTFWAERQCTSCWRYGWPIEHAEGCMCA